MWVCVYVCVLETTISTSERKTYREINPELSVYKTRNHVKEYHIVAFIIFSLSAYPLAIEAGRCRRGRERLPSE